MRMSPWLLAFTQALGVGVLCSQMDRTKITPGLGGQIMSSIMPSLYKPTQRSAVLSLITIWVVMCLLYEFSGQLFIPQGWD